MAESAEELFARVAALVGEQGHLPMPPIAEWDTFPFEGDIRVRPLLAPTPEPDRDGEGDRPCRHCEEPDRGVIWRNDRWLVSTFDRPTGLPVVVFLMTREHLDFEDMDDDLAAEYGRISAWLHRIIGIRANASRMSHAELDVAEKLDDGDPHDLADRYAEVITHLPELELLGGCCGTDERHIRAIAMTCCS